MSTDKLQASTDKVKASTDDSAKLQRITSINGCVHQRICASTDMCINGCMHQRMFASTDKASTAKLQRMSASTDMPQRIKASTDDQHK